MAKKKKLSAPKFNVSMPTAVVPSAEQAKRDAQYKIEDDARTIRSYGKLLADRAGHSKAINLIRSENSMVAQLESRTKGGGMQPRTKARQGRRRLARNIGR